MIDYIKTNWIQLSAVVVAVALVAGTFASSGCTPEEIIPQDIPSGMAKVTQTPSRQSLHQASQTYEQFTEWVSVQVRQYEQNRADKMFWADLSRSFIAFGVEAGQAGIVNSGVPGATLLATALALAGGVMLRKPGDGKKIEDLQQALKDQAIKHIDELRKQKQDSFNAGQERAVALAKGVTP